ncbi:fimbria/pilus outer membrane usher protein [Enterobacter sp. UNJFSC 003]|uniref:fimbria/pilus outer membrane usher protein n=1 Tax=Enterobacter sp. UNJFSC 003 TaxID=3122077 RepID=UPI002EB12ABB|nr:fimbria/pilus outer membrane usher protein [Serratia liquefaciens]
MTLLRILGFMLLFPLAESRATTQKTWVILNNLYKGAISFDVSASGPCLSQPLMEEWGVRHAVLARLVWDTKGCLTPQSAEQFNLKYWYRPEAQLLTLLFPKEAISPQQNGVSTSRWDDGINALFINYRLDADNSQAQYDWEHSGTEATLSLDNGLNVGPWRLRYQNTVWRDKEGQHGSYSNAMSLWRSITPLRSRLTMGDGNTSSNLFDSLTFRGVSLASDEAMYPDSWRPYSPWINGYARSEAEVTIHQNGVRVYRIHVPPGPFTLRDFYPPDPSGNLEMTIQESDGTERTRLLPYSSMPNLVHQGLFSYELAAGRYKPFHGIDRDKDRFWQSTFSWGVAPQVTVFAGLQQGEHYFSQVVGIGGNLGLWGAFSGDVTAARYTQNEASLRGKVWRLRYAKAFFTTETSLTAQLQWYPRGEHYRSLEEKISRADLLRYGWDDDVTQRALRGQLELNQNLGEDTSLSLSWYGLKSRESAGGSTGATLSMNTTLHSVDYSLYGGYERYGKNPDETTVGINISVPFSLWGTTSNVGYTTELASRGEDSHGVNVYGSALSDYSLRYDLKATHTVHHNDELSANLGYQYNAGELNLSMVRGGIRRDYHADTSGSILVHGDGVTLGQQLGSTAALVAVPGSPGIGFYNQFGSTTNANGELLVSYLTPWRVNRITVDSLSLRENTTLDVTELESVPTDGAIVLLRFPQPVSD